MIRRSHIPRCRQCGALNSCGCPFRGSTDYDSPEYLERLAAIADALPHPEKAARLRAIAAELRDLRKRTETTRGREVSGRHACPECGREEK